MDKFYVIPATLLAGLVEYLSTKPFREVGQVIPQLTSLLEFIPSEINEVKSSEPESE